jgi:5-methylcytosine-specific restriction enzyme subunit McrC
MQSDIVLKKGGRVFVVDAKYYTHTTQERFGKRSLHSANLYQIFTYVKNMQASLPASSSPVMGMLLYAKTDNDPAVDSRYVLGGNPIMARTLDLNQEFSTIRAQLDAIATLLDTSE